jgi:pyruvate/2-oxoglutarate dehydrogenase complex dihydrolipoamide dehydrogenase (E3) component
MPDTSFDIVIIGSRSGGYITAIRSHNLVSRPCGTRSLGGICLSWGASHQGLLRSAEVFHTM